MVSIIKNQLLKHLSRYTKNLSPDKVNLSTFRGEGELSNLQLDEEVLTDLLELPSWLRLTSAWCNHVSFRISWTKLKSVPITLTLDEVNITVETCEIARSGTPTAGQSLQIPLGKYNYIHKVIDGITIVVNTVNVNFKSPAFTASVQMSRIRVESRTPKWSHAELKFTRLKDTQYGHILIFKELSWQTVRIEASSTQDKTLTPLRLLTNQAKCRITIKKRLSDCSVIASKLLLILDDLLWVLTDSQLKAALHFVDSLAGLIQASTKAIQRKKAQKKLETLPEYQAQMEQSYSRPTENPQTSSAQRMFNVFDVRETSYHFFSQRIDLHLCDDAGTGRSSHPDLKDGGALQVSIEGFQVDFYPYHLAKANRLHWPKYKEASVPPAMWLEQSLNAFKESLLSLSNPNRPQMHAPLERTPNPNSNLSTPTTPTPSNQISSPMKKHVLDHFSKLMTTCVVVRLEDFTLYRVTTSGKKQMPKEFVSGDKERYSFPPEMPAVHAEFTYFYYAGDFVFPLPPSKCYVYLNPVQVHFDLDSCLWFCSFGLGLAESLMKTKTADALNLPSSPNSSQSEPSMMYMDVKLESIMPRVIFEAGPEAPAQRDRPKIMQIQISRFAITNIREMGASRADLAQAIHSLQEGSLVFSSGFPSQPGDMCIVTDRILSHVAATDITSTQPNSPSSSSSNNLTRYALWSEPRDIWCIKLDPVWIDFLGARSVGSTRAIPFVDAVPITLWIHGKSKYDEELAEKIFDKNMKEERQKMEPETVKTKSYDSLILSVNSLSQLELHNQTSLIDEFGGAQYSSGNYGSYLQDEFNLNNDPLKPSNGEALNNADDENSADLHIIAHVANLVSVQIDHYQFLFLMRLAEELTELTTFLSLDTKRIMQENNPETSIIIGCVIPQLEVTMIMPSQTPGKESSGGDGESVVPDSASLADDLQGGTPWPPAFEHQKTMHGVQSIDSPSPVKNQEKFEYPVEAKSNIKFNIPVTPTVPSTSQGSVPKDFEIIQMPTITGPSNSSSSSSTSTLKNRNRNSISDSVFTKDINTGLSSMKKGFSHFMTSIDSALKTNASFDDASDTISIQSDISSDSEFLTVLADTDKATTDCNDFMFKLNPFANDNKIAPVEVASEVCEDPFLTHMSSPSEPSEASSLRRRDLVQMATFRLTTVEFLRQQKGSTSAARVQVAAISSDECVAIPWDELQTAQQKKLKTKFGARCRAWNMAPYNPESPPCVALRFTEDLHLPADISNIMDKKEVLNWFSRDLNVKVSDLKLQMQMSTVIGLGDLAEDEIIPIPIPMNVDLENVCINLIEDRAPVNITSPGPIPIDLAIGKMKITRDASGVFHIQPKEAESVEKVPVSAENSDASLHKKERDRELLSKQLIMQQLKIDNENLKRTLSDTERYGESHRAKIRQENDVLKSYLKAAQDDISTLLDEKRTLIDTIKSLQQQLMSYDASNGKR